MGDKSHDDGGESVTHPPDPWLYQARPVRTVTPVAYDLEVDLGFSVTRELRVCLRGVKHPDDYTVTDNDHAAVATVTNWFEAAEADEQYQPWVLWIRSYRIGPGGDRDQSDPAGRALWQCDIVRKVDASNLREHMTDTHASMANGIEADGFSFWSNGNSK